MKQFEISELESISPLNFANLFNVYDDPELGSTHKTYSINRTLNFSDLDNKSTDNNALFTPHTVQSGDTWTTLSYKFYQTIELWWLVAKINNIADPTEDPTVGTQIRILKSDIVNQIIQTIREG